MCHIWLAVKMITRNTYQTMYLMANYYNYCRNSFDGTSTLLLVLLCFHLKHSKGSQFGAIVCRIKSSLLCHVCAHLAALGLCFTLLDGVTTRSHRTNFNVVTS